MHVAAWHARGGTEGDASHAKLQARGVREPLEVAYRARVYAFYVFRFFGTGERRDSR